MDQISELILIRLELAISCKSNTQKACQLSQNTYYETSNHDYLLYFVSSMIIDEKRHIMAVCYKLMVKEIKVFLITAGTE